MLNRMHEISKEVGLKIKKRKTEVITEYAQRDKLTLEGENIDNVESFMYLGTIVSN